MKTLAPLISILVLVFVMSVSPVSAQVGSNTPEKLAELSLTPSAVKQTQSQSPATSSLQRPAGQTNPLLTRGASELDRRITALTSLLTQIQNAETISTDVKETLTTQIQTEIDQLTQLQQTIETETDQTVVRSLVVDSYGSFAVFLPKTRTILAGESVLMISDKMLSLHERLALQVSELQSMGIDTSGMEQTLIDAEESIGQAQTDATEAIELVGPLSPEEFPTNRSIIQSARTLIREARLSLVAARDSLSTLVTEMAEIEPSGTEMETSMTETEAMSSGTPAATSETLEVQTSN